MDLTERQLVDIIRREALHASRRAGAPAELRQGIGDDCAILAAAGQNDLLVTTDLFLEDTHFRRKWQAPDSIGHKALARGLSDIAAMGGEPRCAFLSLALPNNVNEEWFRQFLRGFLRLASKAKVALAGGDTGRSLGRIVMDVMVVGEIAKGQSILRSGARAGDQIWVSGKLGSAASGLDMLQGRKRTAGEADTKAFFYPQPRLAIGRFLREKKLASAMMDISDGLSIDLARLCEASSAGARIVEELIPRAPGTSIKHALHGGEDLELLFTVRGDRAGKVPRRIGQVEITRIGEIAHSRQLSIVRKGKEHPLPVLGFQHF